MDLAFIKSFLFGCFVSNYLILFIWFFAFVFARKFIMNIHGKWFPMSEEKIVAIHYTLLGVYKTLVIIFNLIPLIVISVIS